MLTTYGRSTGFCIDPIEKKPLHHFLPGTSVLSFGTAGCNLGCKFCQNHDITKARKVELLSEQASPHAIATTAHQHGCSSVAYTYNDPVVWAEYAIETAKACRERGIRSVAVTAGYISPDARSPFFEFFDAANVDLKAFSEDFYEQVTLSHLQPVLDTIAWLHRETNVWFEVTNLLIPRANDSPAEIRRMCDWLLAHVGDEVPIHFTAFHPDYRMQDCERTPHTTLWKAYDIAHQAGIKHVYLGNVHDAERQSTYCSSCGHQLIERDWYELGAYNVRNSTCSSCGETLPGIFQDTPGTWGRQRLPIKLSTGGQRVETVVTSPSHNSLPAAKEIEMSGDYEASGSILSNAQRGAIHRAACRLVAETVTRAPLSTAGQELGELADRPVQGVYVSLKRKGRLRGCCGFTGRTMSLEQGLAFSAARTAQDDVRLPPVSRTELPFLELEVWLLDEMIPVSVPSAQRATAICIGRDGLRIQRGQQCGLLLPGVAIDQGLNPTTFLQQVCIKAKLPSNAWLAPDTDLQRFEGSCIRARFDSQVFESIETTQDEFVDEESIRRLLAFCRNNVALLLRGAVPNYYASDVTDGMIHGAILSAYGEGDRYAHASKISLRTQLPLQATLYELTEKIAKSLRQRNWQQQVSGIQLAVLEDPAMHGTTNAVDLRGFVTAERAILVLAGDRSGWRYAPDESAETLFARLEQQMALRPDQCGNVYSLRCLSSHSPVEAIHRPTPQAGRESRPPAVAGSFYPDDPDKLQTMVASLLPEETHTPRPWRAALVPHAGLRFSGRIAAKVFAHLDIPETVIVLGPKHTRRGVDWAIAPQSRWEMPGFVVDSDPELAQQLADSIQHLELDSRAHEAEHAVELELPLIHHFAPTAKVVGIALGSGNLDSCRIFASELAKALTRTARRTLLIISSDMHHFARDEENRRLDELAMEALETGNPEQLWTIVQQHQISMCGVLPAIVTIEALVQSRPIEEIRRVAYATSGDVSHHRERVVGYAGMLFD